MYDPKKHNRRSIRLKGYDYSRAGRYFVTLNCQDRAHLFGTVVDGEMQLNEAGQVARDCWLAIPDHFPNVILHEFVIMPDHVHGIIELVGAVRAVRANNDSPPPKPKPKSPPLQGDLPPSLPKDDEEKTADAKQKAVSFRSPSKTIGSIIRGFKIGVTKWMRANTDVQKVWQRNYHDHIIRDERAFQNISAYIRDNPKNWGKKKP